jgi:hypothetical protein
MALAKAKSHVPLVGPICTVFVTPYSSGDAIRFRGELAPSVAAKFIDAPVEFGPALCAANLRECNAFNVS